MFETLLFFRKSITSLNEYQNNTPLMTKKLCVTPRSTGHSYHRLYIYIRTVIVDDLWWCVCMYGCEQRYKLYVLPYHRF